VDRSQHQQNIGLRSSEARSCWLAIAENLIGFASGGATVSHAMRVGSRAVMALARRIVVKSITTSSAVVNTVRVTNGLTNKIRKLKTRRELARQLANISNSENHQSQKEKLYEEMWGIVKHFMIVDVFHKECRISGNPNDRIFQEVFSVFKCKKNMDLHCYFWRELTHHRRMLHKFPLMWIDSDPTYWKLGLDSPAMGIRARSNIVRWQHNWQATETTSACLNVVIQP